MKRKGFTLIELLAVIVILAIITLIATPMILGVIEKARKGASEQSALGYIDAVEKQVAINQVKNENLINDGTYNVPMTGITVKGESPTKGWLKIEKGMVTNYSFVIGKYVITKGSETVKGDTASEKPNGSTTKSGPTMTAAGETDTHKGIVYLDPTDLTKYCDESNSESTTETKTGCMKWYIFDDSENNYTMILDHNTTARIKWNDSNSNVAYEESNLKTVIDDLVTTSGWKITPRLITADEIIKITGNTSFDSTTTSSWFYLDSNNQTISIYDSSNRSKYAWLYNNLNKCKTNSTDYGCTIEDNNTYTGYGTAGDGQTWGYWTSTTVGTASSGSNVWRVSESGRLDYLTANSMYDGVRPVITVSKSILN